jgi:dienelactone hydrolase
MVPWFWFHRQSVTRPVVKSFFEILHAENPDFKVGVAGFCWGGLYSILLGQAPFADKPLVDVVFAAHPSLLSIPKDIQDPIVPISLAVAGEDKVYSPAMLKQTEKAWKQQRCDVTYEGVVYEGAKHGFGVRANMKEEKEKEAMTKSIDQVSNALR